MIKHPPHAHLVVNRVDNDGQTIADNFIGQESRRVCQRLEQQLGLTVAEQRGRAQAPLLGPTHRQATAKTPKAQRDADWQRARHEVANALKHTAPYAGSWDELQAKLSRHDVQLHPSTHQKKDGPQVYGVVFEKDGYRFRGSEVAKEYSASKLQQTFAQHQVQVPTLVQHADQAAKAYEAEALNRVFQEQARQAQEKAQETARQALPAPERQQTPDRAQSGGMEI